MTTHDTAELRARAMAREMGLEAGYLDLRAGGTVVAVREPWSERLSLTASDWRSALRGLEALRVHRESRRT